MKNWLVIILLLVISPIRSQVSDTQVLSLEEYMGWVKQYHPVAKQANLELAKGEAQLLQSRGAFDPKFEFDKHRKDFKDTEYYDKMKAVFKVPTWYGIELKGSWENNTGVFLNPEGIVPEDGLYAAGISVSVLEGLLIDDRRASLRKAKFYREQTLAQQELLLNQILYEAALAYFSWWQAHKEVVIRTDFLQNARVRFEGVKKSVLAGDIPAIDSTEAKVTFQNRQLDLDQARLNKLKNGLQLSNFLWMENEVPIELAETAIPEELFPEKVDRLLLANREEMDEQTIANHPKIKILENKVAQLEIDRQLKANGLLPDVNLEYSFYSQTPDALNSFNTDNYFAGLQISVPLFLRKERGALQLAKYKLQDAELEQVGFTWNLTNKIKEAEAEVSTLRGQVVLNQEIVQNYGLLLQGEERKFQLGESTLFLVNSRENRYIEYSLKQLELKEKLFQSQAKFFNTLALPMP